MFYSWCIVPVVGMSRNGFLQTWITQILKFSFDFVMTFWETLFSFMFLKDIFEEFVFGFRLAVLFL
jgi:hypothetical protein